MTPRHTAVDHARIDANWSAIRAELDAPRPPRLEWVLRRLGVPSHATRLVVATPALRRAWFVSLGLVLLVGLGAAQPGQRDTLFTFLVLAPLVPVLGVAMAYGPSADPGYEMQLATPLRGIRLVTVRAATVLVVSCVVALVLAVLVPAVRPVALWFLLPALAVTSVCLAGMTVLSPRRSATMVGATWVVVAVVVRNAATDPLAAFGAVGQLSSLAAALAGVAVIASRRRSFDRLLWAWTS
jgi:hypothetical protein